MHGARALLTLDAWPRQAGRSAQTQNPKCLTPNVFDPVHGVTEAFKHSARHLRPHAVRGRRIAAIISRNTPRRRGARGPSALGFTSRSLLRLGTPFMYSHPSTAIARLLSALNASPDSQERTRIFSARASSAFMLSMTVRPGRKRSLAQPSSQPDHGSTERAQRRALERLAVQPRQEHRTTQLSAAACGAPPRQQSTHAHAKREVSAHSHPAAPDGSPTAAAWPARRPIVARSAPRAALQRLSPAQAR